MRGLSLVVASGDHSSLRCAGLSLSRRPLLLRSTGSRRAGSVIVAHGPSCSAACGIFPDQGSNPCPLHWQADSQPLRHHGSPVGDFNTSLTPMDRSSKQKINKETQALNDTVDQIDLIDIYRTFYPETADYTFFSSAHGTFSRIDHILGHISSLSKFKKIEIISSIFSDHNAMRLEINYRGKKT